MKQVPVRFDLKTLSIPAYSGMALLRLRLLCFAYGGVTIPRLQPPFVDYKLSWGEFVIVFLKLKLQMLSF